MDAQSQVPSLARQLQEAATARELQERVAAPQESLEGVDLFLVNIVQQVRADAANGKWESAVDLPGKSDAYILAVGQQVKECLGDVMVICDFGNQCIRASWLRSHEC